MTDRCTVERDQATTVDAYNAPVSPVWAPHLVGLACYFWAPQARGEVQGAQNADIYGERLLIPAGSDVTEEDRVSAIYDRLGQAIVSGARDIRQVLRKRDHVLLVLEAVQS